MKYKIDIKQISDNNFWYILKKDGREIARSGKRQTVINIIADGVKSKMVEKNIIEIK